MRGSGRHKADTKDEAGAIVGLEEVDIEEEAVTMASVEQADTEGGAGSVREPDTQVDTEFAEKEDSHYTEFEVELREME